MNAAQDPLKAMQAMGGMPGMDMKITPGAGKISSIPVYTGAKKDGGETTGSDEDGSFASTNYTASASLKQVYAYYDNLVDQSRSPTMLSGSGTSADMNIATIGGLVKIHAESKGENQTSFTMKTYGK